MRDPDPATTAAKDPLTEAVEANRRLLYPCVRCEGKRFTRLFGPHNEPGELVRCFVCDGTGVDARKAPPMAADPDPATTAAEAPLGDYAERAIAAKQRDRQDHYDKGYKDGRAAERQRIRKGARWLRRWSNGGYYVPADVLDGDGDA